MSAFVPVLTIAIIVSSAISPRDSTTENNLNCSVIVSERRGENGVSLLHRLSKIY